MCFQKTSLLQLTGCWVGPSVPYHQDLSKGRLSVLTAWRLASPRPHDPIELKALPCIFYDLTSEITHIILTTCSWLYDMGATTQGVNISRAFGIKVAYHGG